MPPDCARSASARCGATSGTIPFTDPAPAHGTHLLSGGTGGLGLLTGKWLGESGASSVVLASRSGKIGTAEGAKLKKIARCGYQVASCNGSEAVEVRRMICGADSDENARLAGIWHAAGVLADGLLRGQTASSIKRVYAPKACGAFSLQQACATSALDTCVMFSSIAALVGGGRHYARDPRGAA